MIDGNTAALHEYERAQEQQEEALEVVHGRVDDIIDNISILVGQVLDMSQEGIYDFEEDIKEYIIEECNL